MSLPYPIPARLTRTETIVVNSRFVCTVAEAASVPDAQALIHQVKDDLVDASSHAYAYQVGFGMSVIQGCNDGGEPSGTAGRPMLAILQGSGLGDVVAVVSRYFGGTKLGTGGLVRAFGAALKDALDALPRAQRIARSRVSFQIDYALYQRAQLLIVAHTGAIEHEVFEVDVAIDVIFPSPDARAFAAALVDLSAGRVRAVINPL
jgi:uncharacterized YigZ family protein